MQPQLSRAGPQPIVQFTSLEALYKGQLRQQQRNAGGLAAQGSFSLKCRDDERPCLAMTARLFINLMPISHQESLPGTFILGVD